VVKHLNIPIYIIIFVLSLGCSKTKEDAISGMSGSHIRLSNDESIVFFKYPDLYFLVVDKETVNKGNYRLYRSYISEDSREFQLVSKDDFGINAFEVKEGKLNFVIQGGDATSVNVYLDGIITFDTDKSGFKMALFESTDYSKLNHLDLEYISNEHLSSKALSEWLTSELE